VVEAVTINRMLDARIRDLAVRGPGPDRTQNRLDLLQALGLNPLPVRKQLKARVTGTIQRDGYRLEKIRYESFPGFLVTAHLYVPDGPGPFPVILNPHGHFEFKKVQPLIQSRGISLALEGFAALIVDSPGGSWDRNKLNERAAIGDHDNWFLNMGISVAGVYAWDLIRGLDYLETRSDMDCSRVGITGASGVGLATMYTFAIDDRILCAVPVCYATSMEVSTQNGCLCNHVPGVMNLGDRSDILAIRAPAPIMLIGATDDPEFPPEGHRKTFAKLQAVYRSKKSESKIRLELFESKHDYNRRMREAMVAFFREHLLGEPKREHVPEKRPLTDGAHNPYEAGTTPVDDPRLMVTPWFDRETHSFRDLLQTALQDLRQSPYSVEKRLVRWGRYTRIEKIQVGGVLTIVDRGQSSTEPGFISLPVEAIDQRACIYLGLSVPEVLAQWLHHVFPGGPEGWESARVGSMTGDAFTSMIASVKTLVSSANPEAPVTKVIAEGPVASMTSLFLKLYRPNLEIQTSHHFDGWHDALTMEIRQLVQPGARYLAWPFAGFSVLTDVTERIS